MKKIIALTVICCLLACSMSAFAVAENIIIDGTNVTIPEDMGRVCEKDDRTFVPVRFITEYLGCYVNYNAVQQGAAITNPATNFSYYIQAGENAIIEISLQSARAIPMDTEAFINNDEGRMYVPVRFLAEALGYTVGWDAATQTVTMDLASAKENK